jgi:hypothetical protein
MVQDVPAFSDEEVVPAILLVNMRTFGALLTVKGFAKKHRSMQGVARGKINLCSPDDGSERFVLGLPVW